MAALLLLTLAAAPAAYALVQPDNVGRLPAMGWNSWNAYGCDVDEAKILQAANDVVSKGYQAAGYNYINIDDCWSVKTGRDNVTHQLMPNLTSFPNGISGVADEIHALGLKVGIYSSAGTETCGGYPASIGYESIDAATWAAWGIDYLKYDNCYIPDNWTDVCTSCKPDWGYGHDGSYGFNGTCLDTTGDCPAGYNYSQSSTAKRYRIMGDALMAQNRTILYSMCEWGDAEVWTWANATANSWRTTGDITPDFRRVLQIMNENSFYSNYAGFTGHNDPDMLEVGNGNLTLPETRSHFAFWAAMKAPLIIGTDLGNLSQTNTDILLNPYLLDFNQDPVYGAPAQPYKWGVNPDWTFNATNPAEYWAGDSTNGTLVAMLNTLNGTRTMRADFAEIPGLQARGRYKIIDAWTGESMGCVRSGVDMHVESHDTAVLLVQQGCENATSLLY
ncbi:Uu.00g010070.m01.CDS01 [Anthostomella pinea]|uniref:Alpha-galactosidase n=1 Tax=Anthostomella pinea TaxID=933095 RepID=A0AAI8YPZ4_9PEZI|nr:Uu.00g010070.m01.CDS01 [Anthostomella pinea]